MSNIDRENSSMSEGSSLNNWDEKKYRESSKKKSNEEETRKLSVAPTATLKVNNERRVPKTVTDSNFELASDLYIDKGPQLSQTEKKSSSKSSLNSKSTDIGNVSPKSNVSNNKFRLDNKKDNSKSSIHGSSASLGSQSVSQYTDTNYDDDDDDRSPEDPDRSPDYTFFADETIKLTRGVTAYKVIKPENHDESQPLRTIMCLHGLQDSSYIWEDIAEIFSSSADGPQAQIIVMDFYGHGR